MRAKQSEGSDVEVKFTCLFLPFPTEDWVGEQRRNSRAAAKADALREAPVLFRHTRF